MQVGHETMYLYDRREHQAICSSKIPFVNSATTHFFLLQQARTINRLNILVLRTISSSMYDKAKNME